MKNISRENFLAELNSDNDTEHIYNGKEPPQLFSFTPGKEPAWTRDYPKNKHIGNGKNVWFFLLYVFLKFNVDFFTFILNDVAFKVYEVFNCMKYKIYLYIYKIILFQNKYKFNNIKNYVIRNTKNV